MVLVRVDPATLRLPSGRAGWAPQGILAYSKICTHAACAISLYRSPLSPSTQARGPALVCPCHYSTFDVLDGGSVEFGPAGRPLPQLPLTIDTRGELRANGPLSGSVGPSWWGDRHVSRRAPERPVAAIAFVDERLGAARGLRFLMDYVFPDHWSFLLGEIALYSFVVLIATGTFLALFFNADTTQVVYHGATGRSTVRTSRALTPRRLHISFDVSGGLLIRQAHHWAALVFVAAITLHLLRIVFTGAFRKPRDINYFIGVTLLGARDPRGVRRLLAARRPALWDGTRDRLGGRDVDPLDRRPARHRSVGRAVPGVERVRVAAVHRARVRHPRDPRRADRRAPGDHHAPAPLAVPRTRPPRGQRGRHSDVAGLRAALTRPVRRRRGVLVLMGGLIQINPVWLWGPYHPYIGTNGAQPDWYLGWLIGALRIMPNLEIHLFGHTLVPNPFFGGVLFPAIVFGLLYALPWLDRRFVSTATAAATTCSSARATTRARSALAAAVLSAVAVVFAAGSADRLFFQFGFGYEGAIWFFRGAFLVVPVVVYMLTKRVCVELARERAPPVARLERAGSGPQPKRRL